MRRRLFLMAGSFSALHAFQAKKTQPKPEPLWKRILRITGISATSRGLRGGLLVPRGDIWIMAAGGKNKTQQRLTFDGGYYSPVFTPDDRRLLALRKAAFVWVSPANGATERIPFELPGTLKLIAFENRPNEAKPRVVALTESGVGLFSPWDGKFEPFPLGDADEETKEQFLHSRVQYGGVLLQVSGDGHQLTLQRGDGEPVLLASSPKVIYGDPALSHDGLKVVFIREDVPV